MISLKASAGGGSPVPVERATGDAAGPGCRLTAIGVIKVIGGGASGTVCELL